MLDWIFEGIVDWVAGIVTDVMDAISGLFLNALGTDMTAMEVYFPFVGKAFTIMQYAAWAILLIVTVWQLFRAFGSPVTEAENPWALLLRSALFAFLIWFAKPIFLYALEIAKAPYDALMDVSLGKEDFTFAGIEEALKNGLVTIVSVNTVVGSILLIILMITLGWNYFKLLLEVVERYIVVGVLCYTSPLAYSMGASKTTNQVFKSWCRMVGAQLLLLIMNVWFLRAFNSSVGQFIGNGGALPNGYGSVFLWLFCAIAFLKTAQRFDSHLSAIGLSVAQTGSGLGMELLIATRMIAGIGGGFKTAGKMFGSGTSPLSGGGFTGTFTDRFRGNSYIRDAVVQGGTRMGAGGPVGFVCRTFGGLAAKNGASLTGLSVSSVAGRSPDASGMIAGNIADRSLGNYMSHLKGKNLTGTEISGGHIKTTAIGEDGKVANLEFFSAAQFEKPDFPHTEVTASDGSTWYQIAAGEGANAFNDVPYFTGDATEASRVAEIFPDAPAGTTLTSMGDGVLEAQTSDGNSLWYNGAYYEEPDAPHTVMHSSDGMEWYAMQPNSEPPAFRGEEGAAEYNCAQFRNSFPEYEREITSVDASGAENGNFAVGHEDGSATAFYDAARYSTPRGEYESYEDVNGGSWYAVRGEASVERRPVYEDGKPVYDGENVRTVTVESVRYKTTPARYGEPKARGGNISPPRRKR